MLENELLIALLENDAVVAKDELVANEAVPNNEPVMPLVTSNEPVIVKDPVI